MYRWAPVIKYFSNFKYSCHNSPTFVTYCTWIIKTKQIWVGEKLWISSYKYICNQRRKYVDLFCNAHFLIIILIFFLLCHVNESFIAGKHVLHDLFSYLMFFIRHNFKGSLWTILFDLYERWRVISGPQ